MFRLDTTKATTLQISNDAFWYLYQEEEMIDEDNMEEAEEVMSMFPNGFIIKDNYKVVDDEPDLIECTFIPYIEDIDIVWDGEYVGYNSKGIRSDVVLFKVISNERCYMRWFDERDGRILKEGEFDVIRANGNVFCRTSKIGLIPLTGPRVKYFTKARF